MRHRCSPQPDLDLIPIEKIRLPLTRRDELPPLLAGLQWLWTRPTLKAELFALLEDELLHPINARLAAAGRAVFAKRAGAPGAALAVKVDPGVLEADVHFPTDLNRLWDAGRISVDGIERCRDQFGYARPGWRTAKAWRRQPRARANRGLSRCAADPARWRARSTAWNSTVSIAVWMSGGRGIGASWAMAC